MEIAKSKDRPLIKLILVIVALNLIVTAVMAGVFVIAIIGNMDKSNGESTELAPLPQQLATEEGRAQLFEDFKINYNSGDFDQMLSMFGEAHQLELREKGFEKTLETIQKVTSRIDDGAYLRYEFEKLGSGLIQFHLFYNISSPEGLRELSLNIAQQGDQPYEVFGFHISTP
jgi:hypothetical protein